MHCKGSNTAMFSRGKSRGILLLAGVYLTSPYQAAPMLGASLLYQEEETLQVLDYDYFRLKDVNEKVIVEVRDKILVIKTDESVLIDVEVEEIEDVFSEVVEENFMSNSKEAKVAKREEVALTAYIKWLYSW